MSRPVFGESHFVRCSQLKSAVQSHACEKCQRNFNTLPHLKQHQVRCGEGESKYCYDGGCYEAKPTIFDKLLEFGIVVEKDRQFCRSFATWDCEAILEELDLKFRLQHTDERMEERLNQQNIQVEFVNEPVPNQQKREQHKVVTAAIKSTVPGADQTRFFCHEDPDVLVNEILQSLIEISDVNYELEKRRFVGEFQKLEELFQETKRIIDQVTGNGQAAEREKAAITKLQVLHQQLDRHCRQLTLLAYNGSKYDLNLVEKYLMPKLVERVRAAKDNKRKAPPDELAQAEETRWPMAIKRGKAILSLNTTELKFLDVMMYMSGGTNLDQFIKAFNPNGLQKACYPYELIRKYSDLEQITELPPQSAFFSTLKNAGISDQQYLEVQQIWESLPVKNMLEYTKVYNCRDVEPFLQACIKMADTYWHDFGVDIFKEAISIPGVTLSYLFKTLHQTHPDIRFGLFAEKQGDLCQELYGKNSLCGGLSVIGQRLALKDQTAIRNNPAKLVKKVVGFDFNALYLHAIMQEMPTGHPDHWQLNQETGQLELKSDRMEQLLKDRRSHGEVEYLKFKAWLDGIYIHHAEHGAQTTVGIHQYRVDGFAKDASPKPKVFNYNGCHYHYHDSGCMNPHLNLTFADKTMKEKDAKKDSDLTRMGFETETMWECEWKGIKRVAVQLSKGCLIEPQWRPYIYLAKKWMEYQQLHPTRAFDRVDRVAEADMLKAILQDRVFGFAKVNIQTDESKKELFQDFPPIIKHADVGREDIGPFMAEYAQKHNLLKEARDCLIASYFGQEIWIMTPLLQFYDRQGVKVTKLLEVVQYDRQKAFEWFGHKVTEKRVDGNFGGRL